ncbi:hypothetical protein SARC_12227 [Sphaeroforma arctica JP610]|uniref:Uncharacterized protein n=1 Tax=Sphaeroforma arctica JP610 TaxID=667725 RepID=A0A0L0FES1_9EUKA|nr:hypothetical protein SARC_12227 [Sphaeroforma arctica JP610]KNC75245.1 hypothetical protein SARC_12227 [Sphaeroforma arctica JP610]|eukprot:XP_014149147.1 hypothetical protein SARC_12227 [Sphaeroforma arctica JP610]
MLIPSVPLPVPCQTTYVGLWVLAGFMSFFLIEKIMRNGSNGGHEHSHATPAAIFQEKPALVTVVEEDESEREVSVEPPVRASVDRRSRERRSMSRSVSVAPLEVVEAVVVEEVLPQQPIAVAAYLNLVADFSHNFTDGLAIAAAYLASDALGFSTMLAILFHEIPHEVGDYAILIRSGFSRPKAMVAQLSTAIGAMLGAVVGLKAQEFMHTTAWILPLTAGGFIYIATTTVIPDLLTDCSYGQTFLEILAMCTGVGMMVVIAQFEE